MRIKFVQHNNDCIYTTRAGSLLAISVMIIILLSSGLICKQIVVARKKSGSTSATSK